jgi:hypothetical protein
MFQIHGWRILAVLLPAAAAPLGAQTDFYNLDKDRPLRTEDALPAKRGAFEVQLAPLALAQGREGELRYAPSVELKHGVLPGLDVSAGAHLRFEREGRETEAALGEIELSTLLNLWVEGVRLPAAAVRVTGLLPGSGDESARAELKGILSRGIAGPVRLHLNAGLIAGRAPPERWWGGAALDWVLPFRHTLLLAETWVGFPPEGDTRLHSGLGARRQLSPTLALDVGIGRDWRGERRDAWSLGLGVTHEFGLRRRNPGGAR